jgi:hypothetical protein
VLDDPDLTMTTLPSGECPSQEQTLQPGATDAGSEAEVSALQSFLPLDPQLYPQASSPVTSARSRSKRSRDHPL